MLPAPPTRRLALGFLLISSFAAIACGQSGTSASASGSAGAGSGGAGGQGPPPVPLVVLDWNTHNYFDTVNNGASQEEVLSASDYQKKRQTIGGVIKAMNPDLVVLAEIENKGILD